MTRNRHVCHGGCARELIDNFACSSHDGQCKNRCLGNPVVPQFQTVLFHYAFIHDLSILLVLKEKSLHSALRTALEKNQSPFITQHLEGLSQNQPNKIEERLRLISGDLLL